MNDTAFYPDGNSQDESEAEVMNENPNMIPISTHHMGLPIGSLDTTKLPEGLLKYLSINPHIDTPDNVIEFKEHYSGIAATAVATSLLNNMDETKKEITDTSVFEELANVLNTGALVRRFISYWERRDTKDTFRMEVLRKTEGASVLGVLGGIYSEILPNPEELNAMINAVDRFRRQDMAGCQYIIFDPEFIQKVEGVDLAEVIEFGRSMIIHHQTHLENKFNAWYEALEETAGYIINSES
jgi:hypothetical protein